MIEVDIYIYHVSERDCNIVLQYSYLLYCMAIYLFSWVQHFSLFRPCKHKCQKKKTPPILICYILFIGKLLSVSRKYKTLDIHINVSHAKIVKI